MPKAPPLSTQTQGLEKFLPGTPAGGTTVSKVMPQLESRDRASSRKPKLPRHHAGSTGEAGSDLTGLGSDVATPSGVAMPPQHRLKEGSGNEESR